MNQPNPAIDPILNIALADPEATERFAARLAPRLRAGDWIALEGPLGAGKTTLARALIRALAGEDMEVPSPTFTLVEIYELDPAPVWHVDLYRLEDPEEALELGLDDAAAEAILLVEWPDRLGPYLPKGRLVLALDHDAGEGRRLTVTGGVDWPARLGDLDRHE